MLCDDGHANTALERSSGLIESYMAVRPDTEDLQVDSAGLPDSPFVAAGFLVEVPGFAIGDVTVLAP